MEDINIMDFLENEDCEPLNVDGDEAFQAYVSDKQTMTDMVMNDKIDKDVQVKNRISKGVQTLNTSSIKLKKATNVDNKKLSLFLRRASIMMMEALNENEKINIFEKKNVKNKNKVGEVLYVLQNEEKEEDCMMNNYEITDIIWNANGLLLAISYGNNKHQGTCQHQAFISIWNISRRDFQLNKPNMNIPTEGCIKTLTFHPQKPSILVGGSQNGQIFIWDITRKDQKLLVSSQVNPCFHIESISKLLWFKQQRPGSTLSWHHLVSLGTDGKVLVWYFPQKLKYPAKGFTLFGKSKDKVVSGGGLCISNSCEDKKNFIVGTESGHIFKCMINGGLRDRKQFPELEQSGSKAVRWNTNTFLFMSNIQKKYFPDIKIHTVKYCEQNSIKQVMCKHIFESQPDLRKLYPNSLQHFYEGHSGPVFNIQFSPFHRNLFLSTSFDGSIKLFNLLKGKSILEFENQNDFSQHVAWSPFKPTMFCSSTSSGNINIYDLSISQKKAIKTIKYPENKDNKRKTKQNSCIKIEFNENQKDLLVACYKNRKIIIYQLGEQLFQSSQNEQQILEKIADDNKK